MFNRTYEGVINVNPSHLLAGSGTRLWPLSRKSPKQFSKLISETTLFQSSAQRLISSDCVEFTSLILRFGLSIHYSRAVAGCGN